MQASPSGDRPSQSDDMLVLVGDKAAGTHQHTLTGHQDYVRSVAFSPDGKLVASASEDKTVKLWRVAAGTLQHTLTGHQNLVTSVAFSPDGKLVASASDDKTVKLWAVAAVAFHDVESRTQVALKLIFDQHESWNVLEKPEVLETICEKVVSAFGYLAVGRATLVEAIKEIETQAPTTFAAFFAYAAHAIFIMKRAFHLSGRSQHVSLFYLRRL